MKVSADIMGRKKLGKVMMSVRVTPEVKARMLAVKAEEEGKPAVPLPPLAVVVVESATPASEHVKLMKEVERLGADNYRLAGENEALTREVAELQGAQATRSEQSDVESPNLRVKLEKAESRVRELERMGYG